MIKLDVDDYCHDCPEFEPELERLYIEDINFDRHVDTRITCDNQHKCRHIMRYLKALDGGE